VRSPGAVNPIAPSFLTDFAEILPQLFPYKSRFPLILVLVRCLVLEEKWKIKKIKKHSENIRPVVTTGGVFETSSQTDSNILQSTRGVAKLFGWRGWNFRLPVYCIYSQASVPVKNSRKIAQYLM